MNTQNILNEYHSIKLSSDFTQYDDLLLITLAKKFNTTKEYINNTLKKNNIDYKELTKNEQEIIKNEIWELGNITAILNKYKIWNREQVERVLRDNNLHPKNNTQIRELGKNKQTERIRQTCLDRYGVINIGQTLKYGYAANNKIEYTKPKFSDDFNKYKEEVWQKTRKGNPLLYCEYTGIKFADEPCNPNDPCKRSYDHAISIQYGYFLGYTVDQLTAKTNIKQCLKYVNSIKAQTNINDFIPIAIKIREKLIYENYEHQTNFKITTV